MVKGLFKGVQNVIAHIGDEMVRTTLEGVTTKHIQEELARHKYLHENFDSLRHAGMADFSIGCMLTYLELHPSDNKPVLLGDILTFCIKTNCTGALKDEDAIRYLERISKMLPEYASFHDVEDAENRARATKSEALQKNARAKRRSYDLGVIYGSKLEELKNRINGFAMSKSAYVARTADSTSMHGLATVFRNAGGFGLKDDHVITSPPMTDYGHVCVVFRSASRTGGDALVSYYPAPFTGHNTVAATIAALENDQSGTWDHSVCLAFLKHEQARPV